MFREKIQAEYKELTPSFRKIADFILQRQLDVAFMTATELAHLMEVDAATVVRFSQTIGYSGFRELIKEVQSVVKEELKTSYSPDLDAPDDVGLFRSLLENERHNLSLTQAQLTEQVNQLLPMLLESERVWVMGQGVGAYFADLCAHSLREIGIHTVSIPPDPLSVASNLKAIGANDLVIGFSVTGMDLTVADALNFARQEEARTLVFSASPVTAAALAAEVTVICPGPTQTHIPSFTGLAAMIVALTSAFAIHYSEKMKTMQEGMQQSYTKLLELQALSSSEIDVEELWRQF
ncbi:MAG TPA: MurR/RpiR family transcriptional regulator [Chloroflexi bacterium]|nr:MurR/RpiR family transcriptional regulator [Chloroflexota bacterium]